MMKNVDAQMVKKFFSVFKDEYLESENSFSAFNRNNIKA
jgi:uncharacterized membrane protein YesL